MQIISTKDKNHLKVVKNNQKPNNTVTTRENNTYETRIAPGNTKTTTSLKTKLLHQNVAIWLAPKELTENLKMLPVPTF